VIGFFRKTKECRDTLIALKSLAQTFPQGKNPSFLLNPNEGAFVTANNFPAGINDLQVHIFAEAIAAGTQNPEPRTQNPEPRTQNL